MAPRAPVVHDPLSALPASSSAIQRSSSTDKKQQQQVEEATTTASRAWSTTAATKEGVEHNGRTKATGAAAAASKTTDAALPPADNNYNNNHQLALSSSSPSLYNANPNLSSNLGLLGAAANSYMGSGGTFGIMGGAFGGGGLLGSPYASGMMMAPAGPFSGLVQFLFGVQNVIFSASQAVQIVGMNTAALQQLLEAAMSMFEHAVATWQELRVLKDNDDKSFVAKASRTAGGGVPCEETDDKLTLRRRRRRLRTVRWIWVTGVTFTGYKLIRYLCTLMSRRRPLLEQQQIPPLYALPYAPYNAAAPPLMGASDAYNASASSYATPPPFGSGYLYPPPFGSSHPYAGQPPRYY